MRGLAISGQTCAGKNYIVDILLKAIPNSIPIEFSGFIKSYIIEHALTPDGAIDRRRDTPLMQTLGNDPTKSWDELAQRACRAALAESMVPLLSACRLPRDADVAKRLGFPLIMVTAPLPLRIQRLMKRDGLSAAQVLEIINAPTESYMADMEADFTFVNDGRTGFRELARLFTFLSSVR